MIVAATRAQAGSRHKAYTLPNGTRVGLDTYIGTNLVVRSGAAVEEREPEVGAPYPMAYLVSQPAGTTIAPHFHQNDQFQLFIDGTGHIGRHPLAPVTAHFAAAFTAYGPIVAGETAIEYVTLRNGYDPGAQWLPEAKQKLFSRAGRQPRVETSDPVALDETAPGAGPRGLIRLEESGLGAWLHTLGANEPLTGPDPATGSGQFWFTLEGDVRHGTGLLPPRSCVFVSPDERPVRVTACDSGAVFIIAQFPRR